MHRKFRISVDGRTYTVAVEELSADGFPAPEPASAPAAAPVALTAPPVASSVASSVAPPASAPAAATGHDVLAPLAGVVDSIEVRVGQAVKVGDTVAVIEAMKMKTDVFAKVAGTVQTIAVKAKESVDTDQVLLTIG